MGKSRHSGRRSPGGEVSRPRPRSDQVPPFAHPFRPRGAVAAVALIGLLGGHWMSPALAASRDKDHGLGAVVAPATMPEGAASAYVYGGAPQVGVGYRQGVSSTIELEGRFKLNYYLLSLAVEVLLKNTIASDETFALAPYIGIGFVHDTGSRWVTQQNFQYTGIRALAGLIGTIRLGEAATAVGELDLPLDLSLSPTHGVRFAPLTGGGFEFKLTPEVTLLLMGQLGFNYLREPLGLAQWGFGYQLTLGLGFRLF